MNTMIDLQKLPYEIGDKIMHNGKPHTIKGIHLYIGGGGCIHSIRYYIGNGKFITMQVGKNENRQL